MKEMFTIPEGKILLGNICGKHRTSASVIDFKAAVVMLVKGEEGACRWGVVDVCDRSAGNFILCCMKYGYHHVYLWCTICLHSLPWHFTYLTVLCVWVVLCCCKIGNWQSLAKLYLEDSKSVTEAADPDGPGMLGCMETIYALMTWCSLALKVLVCECFGLVKFCVFLCKEQPYCAQTSVSE